MKITDYCPRAAPFDTYLRGENLVGAEIGVDVGAHAEALLRYCPVGKLYLVDPWPKDYQFGFCQGRLSRWRHRFEMVQAGSLAAAPRYLAGLDFVYIDQIHEPDSVAADLLAWWPTVKPGGVLGYRNYVGRGTPLDGAVDAFIARHKAQIEVKVEAGEIVMVKASA